MTDLLKKPLRLGELELEVLEFLWAHGEANVKTVHGGIGHTRNNTVHTIQSTLERLYRKGVLDRRKVAHAFLYTSRYNRTEILTLKIADLAHELSGGETNAVLAAFVEFTARLDDATISDLEAMIAARRENSQEAN